jgi:hypothetical protein
MLGPFHSKKKEATLEGESMQTLLRFYSCQEQSEGAIVRG